MISVIVRTWGEEMGAEITSISRSIELAVAMLRAKGTPERLRGEALDIISDRLEALAVLAAVMGDR
jgi:hypothetical protein